MTMMVGANVECNGNKDERNQLIAAAAGSTLLQLRQRRTDGGGISAAGYVCCIWVDPGGGNPKWEIPSRSNSFVFQSQLRLIREKMHLRFQTGLVQFSNFTILEDLFDFGARDGEGSCTISMTLYYLTKS